MYPVSGMFGTALRASHTAVFRLDAYYRNRALVRDIPITGGQVAVSSGSGVRRTLDVTIADETLWKTLDAYGVELKAFRGVRYPNGVQEMVPLGVFCLDAYGMKVRGGSGIGARSAPDRWARVQRAGFETPETSTRGATVVEEIARLVVAAIPRTRVKILTRNSVKVTRLLWDFDRAAAIAEMAKSIAVDVFFDVAGDLIIADAPSLKRAPVWSVDASASGVLLDGELGRERSRTYNVVIASMGAVDGRTPFPPQVAQDDDPSSRTYVGGPFGRVPLKYSSPHLHNPAQALAAAQALLTKVKAINATLQVDAVVHPGLDAGDVIRVITPAHLAERHLIDSVSVPLTLGGTQQITARSTRPDGDIPEGE